MNYTGSAFINISLALSVILNGFFPCISTEFSFSMKDTYDSCFGRNLARFLRRQHNYTEYLLEQPLCWVSAYDAYSFWNYRIEPICKCPLL